jgi:hypothetical protein
LKIQTAVRSVGNAHAGPAALLSEAETGQRRLDHIEFVVLHRAGGEPSSDAGAMPAKSRGAVAFPLANG